MSDPYVPYSRVDYNGDGVETNFAVPFPFIDRSHVALLVDEEPVSFTWLNDGLIQADVAPAEPEIEGVPNVRVKRTTPADQMLVIFSSPSSFRSEEVNAAFRQALYVVQESFDVAQEGFELAESLQDVLEEVTTLRDQVQVLHAAVSAFNDNIEGINTNLLAVYADVIERYDEMVAALADALNAKDDAEAAAATATAQAGTATSAASTATTQAGIATTKAGEAAASEGVATAAAGTATTQAGTATTQAGIATGAAAVAIAAAASVNLPIIAPGDAGRRLAVTAEEDGYELVDPGEGVGAPTDAEYLTGAASGGLSAERVVTDTPSIAWDLATPGQAKANVVLDAPYTLKYTASGDVVVPDGCTSIDYFLQGPGGGGAGTPSSTPSTTLAVGSSAGSGGRVYGHVDCKPKAIEAATKANPCVITITGHPFYNGDTVKIENIGGMTELEGDEVVVAGRTADTFQLSGVNSTSFGTFTSGGTVRLVKRPLVLGSPGLGGAAGQNNGVAGSNSFFGDAQANTGTAGLSQAAGSAHANVNGGVGGAATGGDLALAGYPGGRACRLSGATYAAFGRGGDSPLGAGGLSPTSAANAGGAGANAAGYGAGGGGAVTGTSGTAVAGGDGAPSILLARFNFL
jgi:hypothetical protein